MKIGQQVMLIGIINIGGAFPVPKIGSVGVIESLIDDDLEYDVFFKDCLHPAVNDPSWVVYYKFLIPLPDAEKKDETMENERVSQP